MRTLTDRFTHAVDYARIAHAHQTRKGSDIPYLVARVVGRLNVLSVD